VSVSPEGELREARFLERPNRFVVVVDLDGERVRAHCPNPGRLGEFLHEGTPFLVRRRPDATPDQATQHSVVAAVDGRFHVDSELALGEAPPAGERGFEDGAWVVLDTQMANRLVLDELGQGTLGGAFPDVERLRAEPSTGEGRFDVAVGTPDGRVLVEVKSVTLVGTDGRTALFPDAPTDRGTRHVRELAERAREGEPVALVLLAMREDAERVAPNTRTDPAFAEAMAEARAAGVDLVGARIAREDGRFRVGERIPVLEDPGEAATGVSSDGTPLGRE